MTIKEFFIKYIKKHKDEYDGFRNDKLECECYIDDLMPHLCECDPEHCKLGHETPFGIEEGKRSKS